MIAPVFDEFSTKYPNAVFLKVDVDKCGDTAAAQGVSAMPTFNFYRNRVKIGQCQGANSNALESKIQQFYGNANQEDSDSPVSGHVNTENAYYHIFGMILLAAIIFYFNKYQYQ